VAAGEKGNDIDIAVYSATDADPHKLSADLKVDLQKKTGIAPDSFVVDKNPEARGDFLERYGTRFRECEGLMQEVLA
jgi:predicted nucleotidyltransferase